MQENTEEFRKNLERLIHLFKKIKEKNINLEMFGGNAAMFANNLDFIIKNFETFKTSITPEMFHQMGFPIQHLVNDLVNELSRELEEEHGIDTSIEAEDSVEAASIIEDKKELLKDVTAIDEMLKNPELSEEEMDRLLDERLKMDKTPRFPKPGQE